MEETRDAGKALLQEADRLNLEGDFIGAEAKYDELLTQNHDTPWLLATLGTLYIRTQRYGLAINLLHQAAKKIKDSEVITNLAIAYKYTGQYQKAMYWFNKAIENNPTAETYATYAGMHINVGTPEKALDSANRALKKNPGHAMAHWNKAMALLEMGAWETAWDEHEWGFEARMRIDRKISDIPVWDGSPGKTVIVYGEQGLGDEIMFASMINDMRKTNTVIIESHRRLKTLFENSFDGITVYGTRERQSIDWVDNHKIDARISIGSLGKYYRRSREAFPGTPYLKSDSLQKSGKFRVGISWTGGLKQGRVRTRSVPLAWWKSILNNQCEFVSLQYTECAEDLKAMRELGYDIKELPETKADDFAEYAKLVKSCDLVISVCTTVIHLAGALGVPCWVMVPSKPAWRYGVSGGMPWYRSVRLYRQKDDWMPVVERIGFDLSELLKKAA